MDRPWQSPDQAAEQLDRWVADHGRAVFGYVRSLLCDEHLAQDIVQEAFARAWIARSRYVESGHVRSYLFRIADRLVCDFRRTKRRERTIGEPEWLTHEPIDEDAPPARIAQDEDCVALDDAMRSLTDAQRRTLLLRYYSELSFAEIARILDCPLNTVLSHCRRGLLALRRLLIGETS